MVSSCSVVTRTDDLRQRRRTARRRIPQSHERQPGAQSAAEHDLGGPEHGRPREAPLAPRLGNTVLKESVECQMLQQLSAPRFARLDIVAYCLSPLSIFVGLGGRFRVQCPLQPFDDRVVVGYSWYFGMLSAMMLRPVSLIRLDGQTEPSPPAMASQAAMATAAVGMMFMAVPQYPNPHPAAAARATGNANPGNFDFKSRENAPTRPGKEQPLLRDMPTASHADGMA